MWEDILKVIQIPKVNLDDKDKPPEYEEDNDCERRFWYLWSMLEAEVRPKDKIIRKPLYRLTETQSVITNTTNKDYCAIIEFFKNLDMEEIIIADGASAKKLGDTLKVKIVPIYHTKNMEYSIEIYQKSPHPLFMISVYDTEGFLEAVRRHA